MGDTWKSVVCEPPLLIHVRGEEQKLPLAMPTACAEPAQTQLLCLMSVSRQIIKAVIQLILGELILLSEECSGP